MSETLSVSRCIELNPHDAPALKIIHFLQLSLATQFRRHASVSENNFFLINCYAHSTRSCLLYSHPSRERCLFTVLPHKFTDSSLVPFDTYAIVMTTGPHTPEIKQIHKRNSLRKKIHFPQKPASDSVEQQNMCLSAFASEKS
jgi:hypothetical protein